MYYQCRYLFGPGLAQSVYWLGYGQDDRVFESRPRRDIFFFPKTVHTGSGTHIPGFFLGSDAIGGVKLTTGLHLVGVVRMTGGVLLFPLYVFMVWKGAILNFTFYCRVKMDAQDMLLDDVIRKQLIWCGHVERMDPTRIPKLWFIGNLKEGKNEAVPEEAGKMEYVQRWVKEIWEWADGTTEGNGVWQSEGVVRRFKTALYIYIYTHTHTHTHSGPLTCELNSFARTGRKSRLFFP
jgi:hypothetical protein